MSINIATLLSFLIFCFVLVASTPPEEVQVISKELRESGRFSLVEDLRKLAKETQEAFAVKNIEPGPIVRGLLDRLIKENTMSQPSIKKSTDNSPEKNEELENTTTTSTDVEDNEDGNKAVKDSKEVENMHLEFDGQTTEFLVPSLFSLPSFKSIDLKNIAGAVGLGALAIGALAASPALPGLLRRSDAKEKSSWFDSLPFWKNKNDPEVLYRYEVPVSQLEYNPYYKLNDGDRVVDTAQYSTPSDPISVRDFRDKTYSYVTDDYSDTENYDYDTNIYRRTDDFYAESQNENQYLVTESSNLFSDIQPKIQRDKNNNAYITVNEVNRIANESLTDILNHYQKFLRRLDTSDQPRSESRNYKIPKNQKSNYNYLYDGNSAEWHPYDKEDAIDPLFEEFLTNYRSDESSNNYLKSNPSNQIFSKSAEKLYNKNPTSKTVYIGQKYDSNKNKFRPSKLDVTVDSTSSVRVITARPYVKTTGVVENVSTEKMITRARKPVVPNRQKYQSRRSEDNNQNKAKSPLAREQAQYQKEFAKQYSRFRRDRSIDQKNSKVESYIEASTD